MKRIVLALLAVGGWHVANAQLQTNAGIQYLQCMPKDVSTDFSDLSNTYFLADSLAQFDAMKGEGLVEWKRYRLSPRQAFNLNGYWPVRMQMLDFPDAAYDNDPQLKIRVDFITPRTARIRLYTTPVIPCTSDQDDPMFCDQFKQSAASSASNASQQQRIGKLWMASQQAGAVTYKSDYGTIEIQKYPFRLVLRDAKGRILTQTRHLIDNDSTQVKLLPFSFIKRGSDNSRSVNPVFLLSPGERIYGCGESFTSLNKVGQRVHLSVTDPQGPETDGMYKPVPFYFSNRGYGVFMHTSAPVTADFGASYIGAQRLFMADEQVDLFVFFGSPKDILNEYTDITGKSPMLPLWSFGTWMSRITYFSQKEGLEIARQLRAHRIPSDVIHFDTGWSTGSVTISLPRTASRTPRRCCGNWPTTASTPACGSCLTSPPRTVSSPRLSTKASISAMLRAVCPTRMPCSTSPTPLPSAGIRTRSSACCDRACLPSSATSARQPLTTAFTITAVAGSTSITSIPCATIKPSGRLSISSIPVPASSGPALPGQAPSAMPSIGAAMLLPTISACWATSAVACPSA